MNRGNMRLAMATALLCAISPAHADEIGTNASLSGIVAATSAGGATSIALTHNVSGVCTFTGQLIAADLVLVEYVAEAVSNGHTAPASTGVKCEVYNSGGYGMAENAFPLAVAATQGQVILPLEAITVCVTSNARFVDNHTASQPRACR